MFVGGLKDDTTEDMVRDVFSEFGDIKEVELINDKATGKSKGFCFVTFEDYDSVDKCVCKFMLGILLFWCHLCNVFFFPPVPVLLPGLFLYNLHKTK